MSQMAECVNPECDHETDGSERDRAQQIRDLRRGLETCPNLNSAG